MNDPRKAPPLRHDDHVLNHPASVCTHFAENPLTWGGGAAPPIHQTSTFIYPDAAAFERRCTPDSPHDDYTRVSNPTTRILEAKIARLENGTWCRAFASGMGAICTAVGAVLHSGAHVVSVAQCYGPTRTLLTTYLRRFGVETTFVPGCNPADFFAAFRPNTRLLYLESPTSGYFEVPDVAPLAAEARRRGITTIFDNSWATPLFQRPLDLGVDLVVHSATKFIGGHSDVVAGLAVGRDESLRRRIAAEGELLGATLDPFAAWLLVRGLRTLPLRMEQHQRSALAVARFLESHPRVARVLHPGLESHPQHETAARQLRGFSSLFSFVLRDNTRDAIHAFLDRLTLFGIGVSWGGFESLAIGGPVFSLDPDRPDYVIRLHVGLEAVDDLIADLKRALDA